MPKLSSTPATDADIAGTPHVLIVDDDARLRDVLCRYLGKNGFLCVTAPGAPEAREVLTALQFDLLVLDVMMPGESGLALTESLPLGERPPILLLTARTGPEDRIAGFEAGADDYLGKPFEPRELLLRLRAIQRRQENGATVAALPAIGPWQFDAQRGRLVSATETVHLTEAETGLLQILVATPGEPVGRDALAERLGLPAGTRGVDVQMTRLRRKVELQPKLPRHLLTVRGAGYVFQP